MTTPQPSQIAATHDYTLDEQRNINIVSEYMELAYSPGRASADAVAHLCGPNNRFIAPTTFPGVDTLEGYAEDHGRLMEQVNDLHIVNFDVLFANADRVCLRYTAEGTHGGKPHGDIAATGRTARWTAAALFRIREAKLVEFIKDWNKLSMWEQLGWPLEECLTAGQG
jgi:predicted ester cyclase